MKIRVHFFYVSIVALVLLILLNACATTETESKTAADNLSVSEELSNEIKISEFILGPRDKIEVMVYRHDDLKRTIQIDTSGKITYPLIGDIQAAGLSIFQLRDKIRDELSRYIVDPQVTVNIIAVQSQKVYVIGEVTKPGVFSLDAPMSVVEAISHAGGFTTDAKDENVMIIRGDRNKPQLVKLDLESVVEDGNIAQNIQLKGGDIVYVPSTFIADASRFSVYLKNILYPILMIEQGIILGDQVGDIYEGNKGKRETNVIINVP